MKKSNILVCECSSGEHQIIFHPDEEDGYIYCEIHLTNRRFWGRLKTGIKYIFGYKCKYGHWDEFILGPDKKEDIKEILEFLEKAK